VLQSSPQGAEEDKVQVVGALCSVLYTLYSIHCFYWLKIGACSWVWLNIGCAATAADNAAAAAAAADGAAVDAPAAAAAGTASV
jgi:hypothetical protein